MVAAVEAGFPQAEIAEAPTSTSGSSSGAAADGGRERPRGGRAGGAHIHRADPEVEARQIELLLAWREGRDPAGHAEALRALRAACEGDENVMPRLVAAAKAGATIGELCDVLREVWGAYRDPARW